MNDKVGAIQLDICRLQEMATETQSKIDLTRDVVSRVSDKVETMHSKTRRKKILLWLVGPDPSSDYHRRRRSRHASTGSWFVESEEYTQWKQNDGATLWLHGKPECGQTVLSSSIITDILVECQSRTMAYYHTFPSISRT